MSADIRRKELYNDLDNHIGGLRKESSTIADKKQEVMGLVNKYYGKVTSAIKGNNSEQPVEEAANDEVIETYDDNAPVEEIPKAEEEEEEKLEENKPSIFTKLLNKIGVERVEKYDEDTEVVDLDEEEPAAQDNHDAKELLSITKEVISKLPEKERDEFANTDHYQKLKDLNNKHK